MNSCFLFHDHPPIAERLSLAERVATKGPDTRGDTEG
jgi:hypothetical protein